MASFRSPPFGSSRFRGLLTVVPECSFDVVELGRTTEVLSVSLRCLTMPALLSKRAALTSVLGAAMLELHASRRVSYNPLQQTTSNLHVRFPSLPAVTANLMTYKTPDRRALHRPTLLFALTLTLTLLTSTRLCFSFSTPVNPSCLPTSSPRGLLIELP